MSTPSSSEWQIASDTAEGRRVVEELLGQLHQHKWDDQDVFGIHLAVEEALVNAIKHGNCDDSRKQVQVTLTLSDTEVRIEIEDEGRGFDPADVPDPTAEENLDAPSGRGLMLMRSFMSVVEFNEVGNRVVMIKERTAG